MDTELIKDDYNNKNKADTFDNILEIVGNHGPFQKRYIWIFNFAYGLIISTIYFNMLMALAVPKHWCYVAGRENSNLSLEQWWDLTIPMEIDSNGESAFSQCKAYNPADENNTVACQDGWEYDKTWYESTIVSDNDWVCDKEIYVTRSFIIGRLGEFVGTIFIGTLGDIFGRRPLIVFTIVTMVLNRILILNVSTNYTWFMIVSSINSLTINTGFLSTVTVSMEIANVKLRETIMSAQYVGWTLGVCILAITMWIVRRWDYFLMMTTFPGLLIFLFYRYMIESPRWLIQRGKIHKAYVQLKRIADVNNKDLPDNFLDRLYAMHKKGSGDNCGVSSLISSRRLFRNTVLLVVCWSSILLVLQILLYNFANMKGNPFLNFLLLSLVELPVNIFGKIFSKYFGRRFAILFALTSAGLSTIGVVLTLKWETPVLTTSLVLCIKFFIYLACYIIDLQALEVFPTCARQSGISVCLFFANAVCCMSPYISYLGTMYDIRYPYVVIFLLTLLGAIVGSFLPETARATLPESIEDAREFGKNQSYWNFLNRKQKYSRTQING